MEQFGPTMCNGDWWNTKKVAQSILSTKTLVQWSLLFKIVIQRSSNRNSIAGGKGLTEECRELSYQDGIFTIGQSIPCMLVQRIYIAPSFLRLINRQVVRHYIQTCTQTRVKKRFVKYCIVQKFFIQWPTTR